MYMMITVWKRREGMEGQLTHEALADGITSHELKLWNNELGRKDKKREKTQLNYYIEQIIV